MPLKSKKINNLRKVIRLLQINPIILSLIVVIGFMCDQYELDFAWYLSSSFGFSLFVLIIFYAISRKLYVSLWSKILYLDLMMVSAVDLADNVFDFSMRFINLQEFIFSIFIVGCLSSLLTFIYDKWKYKI